MRTKLHHLSQRGTARTWYCLVAVPKPLRPAFGGKHHLLRNLGTTDLAVALAKRTPALAEFEALIAHARQPEKTATVMEAASELQRQYQRIGRGDLAGMHFPKPTPGSGWTERDMAVAVMSEGIAQAADELAARYTPAIAAGFVGVAIGVATPLMLHIDSWLAEGGTKGPLSQKAKKQYKSAVGKLETWLIQSGRPATIECVDRKTVGSYVTETMIDKSIDRVTANSWISPCSSYWRWLCKRMGVEANPWREQGFAKPSQRSADKRSKRPYTDDELAKLLAGNADSLMHDVIRIAALSAMRRSEIFALKVGHCQAGAFDIRVGKTDNSVRRVPLHTDLKDVVARHCQGKAPDDWLIDYPGKNRADAFGKSFAVYRQACGVTDEIPGKRQDRLDFHGLRRWAITQMRKMYDQNVVADVAGHERDDNVTDRVYAGASGWDVMTACIESIRLPPKPE